MSKICPICRKELDIFLDRYPRMICSKCANSYNIIDSHGNNVSFENESFYGGFTSLHMIDNIIIKKKDHICYIDNIKCYADEAIYGGIVIQMVDF